MAAHTKCEYCGASMQMRYPGNDPENGPARLRCFLFDACRDRQDEAEALAEMAERYRLGHELIERLTLAKETVKSEALSKLLEDAALWIQEAM